jgi:putative methionine-R-sulfoxide reductase with GAF domain
VERSWCTGTSHFRDHKRADFASNQGKETINVGDVTQDPDYLTALATTQSEIIVPVLDVAHNSVIGTIDVESQLTNAFDSVTQNELEECAIVLRRFWRRF